MQLNLQHSAFNCLHSLWSDNCYFLKKQNAMKNDKNRKPTDEGLKSYNPADRDFQRTEEQTDRVSQSEIDEQKREKSKKKR